MATRGFSTKLYPLAVLVLLSAAACGSAGNGATDSGPPDTQTPADGAVDLARPDQSTLGSLAVKVLQVDGVSLPMGFSPDETTLKPVAGATVAADLPGGSRVELTTGTDGAVTFKDVDWSSGTAAVTAYAAGYPLVTTTGIVEVDGEQTLTLPRVAPPATIKVSGTVQNMDPSANYLAVGASTYSWSFEGSGLTAPTSFELEVEAGKPFTLLANHKKWEPWTSRETHSTCFGWIKAEHPGSTQPVTVDLDFATNNVTPIKVTGTFTMPATGVVGTASRPRFWVRTRHNSLILGSCTNTTEQGNNELSYEGEYIKLAEEKDVFTTYYAEVGTNWHGSYIVEPGYPKDGAKVGADFLEVPQLTQPAIVDKPAPRSSAIVWKAPDPAAIPILYLGNTTKGTSAWTVRCKPGTAQLVLPELPSTAKASEVLGTDPMTARVAFRADPDAAAGYYRRQANSKLFQVDPGTP
jgi:hypothetical protein